MHTTAPIKVNFYQKADVLKVVNTVKLNVLNGESIYIEGKHVKVKLNSVRRTCQLFRG